MVEKKVERIPSLENDLATLLAEHTRELLGGEVSALAESEGISSEDTLRYMSLSAHVIDAREERGLSIRDVSRRLRVAQYRLRAVEEGSFGQIQADAFAKYVDFLSVSTFVFSWVDNNPELAERAGVGAGARRLKERRAWHSRRRRRVAERETK